jgi:hypothetical protein
VSFEDLDFGEKLVGKPVTEMDARELFKYSYEMFRENLGYTMPSDFIKNKAVLQWLLKTYREDGAKLVKWLFFKYDGIIDNEAFAINWFAAPHKWRIDKELFVMKQALGEIKKKPVYRAPSGSKFMSVKDLMAYGNSA